MTQTGGVLSPWHWSDVDVAVWQTTVWIIVSCALLLIRGKRSIVVSSDFSNTLPPLFSLGWLQTVDGSLPC